MAAKQPQSAPPSPEYNLPPRPGKRVWRMRIAAFLAVAIIVFGGWSAVWFWAADRFEQVVDAQMEALARADIDMRCTDREVIGFPFRLGISCTTISALTATNRIETGALRSAAQLYAPGRFITELAGPVAIDRNGAVPLRLDWTAAKASGRAGLADLPHTEIERLSVELDQPRLADGWNEAAGPMAAAETMHLHYRQAPDAPGDIDLAANTEGLQLAGSGLPALAARTDARIEAIEPHLRPGFDLREHIVENGLTGTLRRLAVAASEDGDNADLALSGPFSLDTGGRLSGRLKLEIASIAAVRPFIEALFGDANVGVDDLLLMLQLIPTDGDGERRSIVLNIDRGVVSAGLLELGRLPPLL